MYIYSYKNYFIIFTYVVYAIKIEVSLFEAVIINR